LLNNDNIEIVGADLAYNKIHVQTNTESVQYLSRNTKHNKVCITQVHEQLT